MEDLADKLKLLEYEKIFITQKYFLNDYYYRNMKPLNKAYFAVQINVQEQFNYFKMLIKNKNYELDQLNGYFR